MNGRTRAVASNVFNRLRHDKRTLGMIVMMPVIFMVLFGFAFAGEPKNVAMIVVNDDSNLSIPSSAVPSLKLILGDVLGNLSSDVNLSFSEPVIERLRRDETLRIRISSNASWARRQVDRGEAWAFLHFPENYSKALLARLLESMLPAKTSGAIPLPVEMIRKRLGPLLEGAAGNDSSAVLYADKSDTQIYSAVMRATSNAFLESFKEYSPMGRTMEFFTTVNAYGEEAEFIDFFAPGIMVLAVTMITVILTIISFVRERNAGTLARMFASPMTSGELVGGYAIAFGIIAALQSTELLALGVLFFNIHIVGSTILALGIIVLLALGIQGLGILLSTLAKTEFQAIQFIPLVMIPVLILSGIFWPVESMPSFFKPVSALLPTTYAVNALRSVIVRGWGLGQVLPDLVIIAAFAGLVLLAAVQVMKRKAMNL